MPDEFLAERRARANSYLTDTCIIRRDVSEQPLPAPSNSSDSGGSETETPTVSDGQGGTVFTPPAGSDGQGGEASAYLDSQPIPCRLQATPSPRGEQIAGDKPTQRSRAVLVLPWDTAIGNTDLVVTAAGNDGRERTLEVLDTGGRTDGMTRRVTVLEVK